MNKTAFGVFFNLVFRKFIFLKIIHSTIHFRHTKCILYMWKMPSNRILMWWQNANSLTLSAQMKTIATTPCCTTWATNGLSVTVSFAKTTWAFTGWGETTQFTMFLNSFADPVDLWIATNSIVSWIDQDHFKVFVWWILCHPVWVQNSQTTKSATDTFLREKR